MNRKNIVIPPLAVRRLTRYLTYLQGLMELSIEWVSSKEIAEALGLTSSTVRQDLSYVDCYGISKRGYEIIKLVQALSSVLGADRRWKMVVIGAGNLGKALVLHEEFQRRQFLIVGIFDNDEKKIGKKVGSLQIREMKELAPVISRERVDVGIIAVPTHVAQRAADLLIVSGVKGILNLALTHIIAPAGVSVIDSRIVNSLMELSHAVHSSERRG